VFGGLVVVGVMIMSNVEEFRRLFQQEFKVDERAVELEKRVEQYFRDTENCSERKAMGHRKELTNWCRYSGYTGDEVRRTKQVVLNRIGNSL